MLASDTAFSLLASNFGGLPGSLSSWALVAFEKGEGYWIFLYDHLCFIGHWLQLLGTCQMVMLQNRTFPCLIDACGVITGMMHMLSLTLVICHQAFWWIVLASGMAGSVYLQTEWHLRQALNGSIIQGMPQVAWSFFLPLALGKVQIPAAALSMAWQWTLTPWLWKGAGHLFCNL